MPVRPPPRNGSCSTPGSRTRSVRSTRARRSWTGWSRSRSAASRSRPPRRPASGATTASTSSTRPATSTSPPRSSARCACSTAPWRSSTRCRASSRSPRRSGARPTSTASRASASSTRWTASAPTSARTLEQIERKLQANPVAIQLPIGSEEHFTGVIDLIGMRAIRYKDETLGAEYVVEDIPADLLDEAKHYREILVEKATEADDALLEKYVAGEAITEDELRAGHPQARHPLGAPREAAVRPGHLRLGLQEQGRAAAARRRRRLPARRRSTSRRSSASTRARPRRRRSSGPRPTRRRSPRWPSRS